MAYEHKKNQQPTNTSSSQTRRTALKKMLVGTGVAAGTAILPDKWAKPVVDRVLVPAHAQTSEPSGPRIRCGDPLFPVALSLPINVTVSQNPWLGEAPLVITNNTGDDGSFRIDWISCDDERPYYTNSATDGDVIFTFPIGFHAGRRSGRVTQTA